MSRADEKEFRFQSKAGLLTYSGVQCAAVTLDSFVAAFVDLFSPARRHGAAALKSYCVGRELHHDGTPHFHVYFCLTQKPNYRSCRVLDLSCPCGCGRNLHPNFAALKRGDHSGAYEYARKQSEYRERNIDLFQNSRGFVRRKSDFDAWARHREHSALTHPQWPLSLPTGPPLNEPRLEQRARIILITGPADWGKSYWLEQQFAGQLIYKRQPSDFPYDSYEGESVIVCDDPPTVPDIFELISVNNVYLTRTPVFGRTRYHPRFWPMRQARVFILVLNDLAQLPYSDDPRFTSRLWVHCNLLGVPNPALA